MSKGMQMLPTTHEFKEELYEVTPLQKSPANTTKRIKLLEVFVEKAKSMTLGQRLYWHLNQMGRTLSFTNLPDAHEFNLRPLNTTFFSNLKEEQEYLHIKIEGGSADVAQPEQGHYCQESNTVFYYKEYKVLLMLDFSKSTSTIFANQGKCYVEKMQESIEILIQNLWFKLNNKYQKSDLEETKQSRRKMSHQGEDIFQGKLAHTKQRESVIDEVTEEQEDASPNFPQERKSDFSDNEEQKIPLHRVRKSFAKENRPQPVEYCPVIYLTIAASGLPPDNNIRLIVQNQRLDDSNRTEILKSLNKRLDMIISHLVQNYNCPHDESKDCQEEGPQPEYLERHLGNASKVLNLMKSGAKPLLVLFTDSTSSLMGRAFHQSKNLDSILGRLHATDTKIITIDLGDQNRVANTFGYVNHDEHLKYLAYVTSGAHFDYHTLIKLAGKFSQNLSSYHHMTTQGFLQLQANPTIGLSKLNVLTGIRTCSSIQSPLSLTHHHYSHGFPNTQQLPTDLSDSDTFHPHLNSLQKLLFARPCNYSAFLQHSEIQQLVNFQERLIFENRVSSDLVKQLRKDKNLVVNPSFSVRELLLNGRYVPIFRKEQLSEYKLYKVEKVSQLCEYRSRLCFQFRRVTQSEIDSPGSKVYYQYWWSNQVLILCTIEQMGEQDEASVVVRYKLVAQEEVIEQLKRERGHIIQKEAKKTTNKDYSQMFNNYYAQHPENTLLNQLTQFMKSVQKCDKRIELFQVLTSDIRKTYKVLRLKQANQHLKYTQHSFIQITRKGSSRSIDRGVKTFADEDLEGQTPQSNSLTKKSKKSRRKQEAQQPKKQPITEEKVYQYLHKRSKIWLKLCKFKVQLWRQLLIYSRLDLVTQSHLEGQVLANATGSIDEHIESVRCQDNQISKRIEQLLRSFCTLQLDGSTFLQVFKEKRFDKKQFGFGLIRIEWAAQNIGVCHFGFYQVSPKTIANFQQQLKKVCLNQTLPHHTLSMGALNEEKKLVVHAYDKEIASILVPDNFQFSDYHDKSGDHHNQHISHSERTKHEDPPVDLEDVFFKPHPGVNNKNQFKGEVDKLKDLCFHKEWVWKNDNATTNRDFFEILVKQRLKEGFIFVNRHQHEDHQEKQCDEHDSLSSFGDKRPEGSDEQQYLFIKVVKACKQRKVKGAQCFNAPAKKKMSSMGKLNLFPGKHHYDNCIADQKQEVCSTNDLCLEETQILIQYVIHVPKQISHSPKKIDSPITESPSISNQTPEIESSSKSDQQTATFKCSHTVFRTEVFMDQESAFFIIEKNQGVSNSSLIGGSFLKKESQLQENFNVLSEKVFFHDLFEYMNGADSFLFNNICSYHNLVKNSVLKVTDINLAQIENQPIKSEVCYFNNLLVANGQPLRSVKMRKRLRLENAIKNKMQLLRKDWTEFLKINYPEIMKGQVELETGKVAQKTKEIQKIDKDIKVYEEKGFTLQIEELLENSKLIKKESLNVPEFVFNQRPSNFKEILASFYDQILRIYEEFSDFRIIKFQNELHSTDKYLYFAKMVTKQVIFVMKLPSKSCFLENILSQRGHEGSLEVEYYKLTKRMIKLSKKLAKSKIITFLNPDYNHLPNLNAEEKTSFFERSRKVSLDTSKSGKGVEIISTNNEVCEDDDDDEEIVNQVDLIFDFVFIYEMSQRDNQHQLQFESHISTIISNFESYLRENYNIIFADTVLLNILDNDPDSLNESENIVQTSNELLKNDFSKIKSTLTRCRFRMDISFLCLIAKHVLLTMGKTVDNSADSQKVFEDALDEVYVNIIQRNFREFETDTDYLVFKKNEKFDGEILKEDEDYHRPENIQQQHSEMAESYLFNLEGTKDSYSDTEEVGDEDFTRRRRRYNPSSRSKINQENAREFYASCKKVLFKVDLVIKNSSGDVILEKKLNKFSEIFVPENKDMILQVCSELESKARYIVQDHHQQAKEQEETLMFEQAAMEGNPEQFWKHLESNQKVESEHSDAQSGVEIYFSFYTIPQYVGLVRDQDVDFLCYEQDEILVNDDDHEDLIRVTKICNLNSTSSDRRLEFEDLSLYGSDWPLFRQFNKKQLVKSIPYYFKSNQSLQKDYRVYQYDEIQRKIIYGILRRTYALIAQRFLEYLSMITTNFDALNLIIQQKYMGSLLFNQRKALNLHVIDCVPSKFPMTLNILKSELTQGSVLNLGLAKIGDSQDQLFYLKSSAKVNNFPLKQQLKEDSGDIEHSFIKQASQTLSLGDLDDYFNEKLNKVEENYTIPFWLCLRVISESHQNLSSMSLEVVYHLPMYKHHNQLTEEVINKELRQLITKIGQRINVMLLMQQIDERREFPSNLVLDDQDQADVSTNAQKRSLSNATNQITHARMENAKNKMLNDTISSQQTPLLKQGSSQQIVPPVAQKPNAVTSRFKARMDRLNKKDTIKEDLQNEPATNIIEQPNETTTAQITSSSVSFIGPSFQQQQKIKAMEFLAQKVFHHSFNLNHSVIKVEDGIQAIQEKTFQHFRIDNRENLFISRRDGNVYLIKITGYSGTHHETQGKQNIMKSFNQSSMLIPTSSHFTIDASKGLQVDELQVNPFNIESSKQSLSKSPLVSNYLMNTPTQTAVKTVQPSNSNSYGVINMEIFGTHPPLRAHIEPLIQSIEMNLTRITIEKLAESLLKHPDHIYKEDSAYLEASDNKMILAFPINDCQLTDKYALLTYLKQNMSRFFNPVTQLSQSAQHLQKGRGQGITLSSEYEFPRTQHQFNQSIISGGSPSMESKLKGFNLFKQGSFQTNFSQRLGTQEAQVRPGSILLKSMDEPISTDPIEENTSIRRVENDDQISESIDGQVFNHKDLKISYKKEDFTLLYNYQKKVGKIKNDKKGQYFTLENVFGQGLALIQLQIQTQFNKDVLENLSQSQAPLNESETSNDALQRMLQNYLLQFFPISEDVQTGAERLLNLGLKITPDHESCTFPRKDYKLKSYMPIILQSCKACGTKGLQNFKNVNNDYQIPEPSNIDANQKWLIIKLDHIGSLTHDRFIKNIILNVNQAVNEFLVERYIQNALLDPIEPSGQKSGFTLTPNFMNEASKPPKEPAKVEKTIWNQISNLESIIFHGKQLCITNIVNMMEKLIYGDSSDIITTLFNSLVANLHQDFRSIANQHRNQIGAQWYMHIVIDLVNKTSSKLEKTLVFHFGEEILTSTYDMFQKEIRTHLSKTKTILRNIHPQFKLIMGSFDLNIASSATVYVKDFRTQLFQFDGLIPEGSPKSPITMRDQLSRIDISGRDNIIMDALYDFKIYPTIQSHVILSAQPLQSESQAELNYPRNFFLVLTIADSKLTYKSFNIDKKIRKRCKSIILSHLIWQSNRQHFFKRIISQKLGTVYTLKDYYSSDHLIKDQTISKLYTSDKFTYEKAATIIEGKQIYNFTRAIKRQQKQNKEIDPRLTKINQKRKKKVKALPQIGDNHHEGKDSKNLQIEGEEYLKKIKSEEWLLKNVFKKSSFKESSLPQVNTKEEIKNQLSLLPKNRMIHNKSGLIATGSLMELEKAKTPSNDASEQVRKLKGQKLLIQFQEFIQNKVISRPLCFRDKNQEIKLTHMFVISPSLQPSRANVIQEERERLKALKNVQNQRGKQLLSEENQVQMSNRVLMSNPLYFHGMRMIQMLEGFFNRVKYSQKMSIIFKQCEDLIVRKSKDPVHEEMQLFRSFIQQLAGKERFRSHEQKLNMLNLIISKSRLLYSNTTQQLFDQGNETMINVNETHFDEIKQEGRGGFNTQSILGNEQLLSKVAQQNEELKVDFLNDYNMFLRNKLGVAEAICHMFSAPKDNYQNQLNLLRNSKRLKKSKNNLVNSSQASLKRAAGLTGDDEQTHTKDGIRGLNSRPKKFSEDFNDPLFKDSQDKLVKNASNSSLVISSNHQESQQYAYMLSRRRQERVLHQINEESVENQHQLYSYLVKTLQDDSLIIYELTFNNGLIRINVFKYESIIKGLPRSISSNYSLLQQQHRIASPLHDKKALVVSEEQRLSTRLNTDSCNYDFHLKEISKQIVFQSKKHFNISQQIQNVLSFYKTPPKFSRNYMDVVVLKIDLGFMNRISGEVFLNEFLQNSSEYGFKMIPNQYQGPSATINNQNSNQHSYSVLGASPMQGKIFNDMNKKIAKCAFFKEEGNKAKIENFEQNQGNLMQSSSSRRTTSIAFNPFASNTGQKNLTYYQPPSFGGNMMQQIEDVDHVTNELLQRKGDYQAPSRAQSTTLNHRVVQQAKQSFVSQEPQNTQPTQQVKKLFYLELKSSQGRDKSDSNQLNSQPDAYKKIWDMQIRRQETTDSQIGADDDDANSTILELDFYMIYTQDLGPATQTPGSSTQASSSDLRNNSERYPLQDVCTDMAKFIHSMSEKFTECRTNIIKEQLWVKFFDKSREIVNSNSRTIAHLTDAQIHDMLKFSLKYDLRTADDRYKDILSLDLYKKSLFDYLKHVFAKNCHQFSNFVQYGAAAQRDQLNQMYPDLLVFDTDFRHFLIHIEFNYQDKKVYVNLIRKNSTDIFRHDSEATEYGEGMQFPMMSLSGGPLRNQQRGRVLQELMPIELNLVKQVMNHLAFWLWKKAV